MSRYDVQVTRYSGQSQEDLSELFFEYTNGRYCADWSLDVRVAQRLERERLFAFLQRNAASSWVAMQGGRVLGVLGLQKSVWDTVFWGINYISVDHLYSCALEEDFKKYIMGKLVDAADEWCRDEKVDFAQARPDVFDLPGIQALEDHGFRYIETTVTNSYDLRRMAECPAVDYLIRNARPDEVNLLAGIARDAFPTHRFYADKRFPKEKVDAMYWEWIRSSVESTAWTTIVLEAEGKVRGYFVYRIEDLTDYFGLRFVKWRSAALAPNEIGKGYGVPLFQGAMQYVRGQAEVVDSGLTIRNVRSFNLHNKLGFRILCSSVTLHKWYS